MSSQHQIKQLFVITDQVGSTGSHCQPVLKHGKGHQETGGYTEMPKATDIAAEVDSSISQRPQTPIKGGPSTTLVEL